MHAILAEAAGLVDGRRTLAEIAALFGKRHGLPPAEAEASLRGLFLKQWEESR
jgi:hypothetical protein